MMLQRADPFGQAQIRCHRLKIASGHKWHIDRIPIIGAAQRVEYLPNNLRTQVTLRLDGCIAQMRRINHPRQSDQGRCAGWLYAENIKRRACDLPGTECVRECVFVDQAAMRAVDNPHPALDHRERARIQDMIRFGGNRAVQTDKIGRINTSSSPTSFRRKSLTCPSATYGS